MISVLKYICLWFSVIVFYNVVFWTLVLIPIYIFRGIDWVLSKIGLDESGSTFKPIGG